MPLIEWKVTCYPGCAPFGWRDLDFIVPGLRKLATGDWERHFKPLFLSPAKKFSPAFGTRVGLPTNRNRDVFQIDCPAGAVG